MECYKTFHHPPSPHLPSLPCLYGYSMLLFYEYFMLIIKREREIETKFLIDSFKKLSKNVNSKIKILWKFFYKWFLHEYLSFLINKGRFSNSWKFKKLTSTILKITLRKVKSILENSAVFRFYITTRKQFSDE